MQHKPAKQSIRLDSEDSRLPVHYSQIMDSENAPKETVQSFIDLANIANRLIDENQQPSVTQELGGMFLSTRGGGRRGERRELLRVGAGEPSILATDTNNTGFATWSTTKGAIEEIWGSKTRSKKPQKSM